MLPCTGRALRQKWRAMEKERHGDGHLAQPDAQQVQEENRQVAEALGLTVEEYESMQSARGHEADDEELCREIFNVCFGAVMMYRQLIVHPPAAPSQSFDEDGSGDISPEELRSALQRLPLPLSQAQVSSPAALRTAAAPSSPHALARARCYCGRLKKWCKTRMRMEMAASVLRSLCE